LEFLGPCCFIWIEPSLDFIGAVLEDNRHPVMQETNLLIWRGRDNCISIRLLI
jgi:hypothetical protein